VLSDPLAGARERHGCSPYCSGNDPHIRDGHVLLHTSARRRAASLLFVTPLPSDILGLVFGLPWLPRVSARGRGARPKPLSADTKKDKKFFLATMSETQDTTATTSSAAAPAPVAQPQQQQPAQQQQQPQQQQQQQQQSAPAQSQPQPQQQTTDQSSNVAPQAQAQAAVGVPQATTSAPTTTAHNGNTTQTQTQAQTSDQSLVCMWQGCSERLPTPEALYVSCISSVTSPLFSCCCCHILPLRSRLESLPSSAPAL